MPVVAYGLPVAVGILLSSEQVVADCSRYIFLGELSLDGSLRHTHGILPTVALRDNFIKITKRRTSVAIPGNRAADKQTSFLVVEEEELDFQGLSRE